MPDFGRIINLAYTRILGRPADPGGQESYDRLMNQGMSEAQMRESLLRSDEYAAKHPDRAAAATRASGTERRSKAKKKSRPKKRAKKATRRQSR